MSYNHRNQRPSRLRARSCLRCADRPRGLPTHRKSVTNVLNRAATADSRGSEGGGGPGLPPTGALFVQDPGRGAFFKPIAAMGDPESRLSSSPSLPKKPGSRSVLGARGRGTVYTYIRALWMGLAFLTAQRSRARLLRSPRDKDRRRRGNRSGDRHRSVGRASANTPSSI